MAAPLPPALEARLAALAVRVRRLRVVRGASTAAVAAILSAIALLFLDAAADLSLPARCLLQLAWLGFVGFLIWRLVVRPWRADVPLAEVARRVERQFPGLGERLLTVVSLRDESDSAHGSPRLVAGLARETEQQTRNLDFAAAAPIRPAAQLAAAAGLVLLVAMVSAAVVPGAGERLRRVGLPWYRPTVAAPYRVVVSSGNPVIRRGEPVTLSAYLERIDPAAALPDAAVLVFGDGRRLPMAGDGSAGFHVTLPAVAADFDYRVEVGPAASARFTVLVADPVELADGTTAEIVPPPYAAGVAPRSVPGLTELDGLQHSAAARRLRFTRPAATAFLEWRPDDAPPGPGTVLPLTIDPDRTGATATVPLPQSGTLHVVLMNESGPRRLRTDVPIPVRVTADTPPRFEQVSGVSPLPRVVRPTERVLVTFAATDDVGVGAAELEYAVGPESPPVRVPVALAGAGTPRAEGRILFDLTGKAAEGQTVRLRVRVTDSRRLDAPPLGPQQAVYPADGWAEFTLSSSAPPLDRQEVFGQRDAIRDALLAALKDVSETADEVETLRKETAGRTPLPTEHRVLRDRAAERVGRATDALHGAARDAALTPDLRTLATAVREVADRPLRDATDHLAKAGTDHPADRVAALAAARAELLDAKAKIEGLLDRNARVAQDRLDRRRLDALAADQTAIADRLKSGTPPEELRATQTELLKRFRATVAESDVLRRGLEGSAGRELHRLAADARSVAAAVRDLDVTARGLTAETRKQLLAQAGKEQADAVAAAEPVLRRVELAARLAGVIAPRVEDFRRVADLIARDDLVAALTELETIAADLDRTAEVFEKRAAERTDAKAAARQLAQWQEDVRTRLIVATKDAPFAKLPDAAKTAFRVEQRAIRDAAGRLRLPSDPQTTEARGVALTALGKAVAETDGDGKQAEPAMKAAADALHRLADRTPSVPARLAAARAEFDRIRLDQDSVIVTAEQVIRPVSERPIDAAAVSGLAVRLAATREKQQRLADRLAALDLPGFEPRRAWAVAALRLAVADLADGSPFDILASLYAAKRKLDRLRQALDAPPATDDKADELAALQAGIVRDLVALGPAPTARQLEPLAFTQREITKQLEFLPAPEAAALLFDAREAVRLAEFREGAKPDDLLRRTVVAAEALRRLADRLTGRESDLDRVRRLAAARFTAADEARRLAGTKFNPDASDAAKRQLGREIDELTHTRVGPEAQAAKRDVLRMYTDLQRQTEPDRQAAAQKGLGEALDALAARMADDADLAFPRPRETPPIVAAPEDGFLPSKPLAADLRAVARHQRVVRDRVGAVNAEAARQMKPAAAKRAAREDDLARRAGALADRLDAAAKEAAPGAAATALTDAAKKARAAEKALRDAARKDRDGATAEADKLRAAALRLLDDAADRAEAAAGAKPGAAPMPDHDPVVAATGDALREAEQSMRSAEWELQPGGDAAAAEREMRKAAAVLTRATKAPPG